MWKYQCFVLLGVVVLSVVSRSAADNVQYEVCESNSETTASCDIHQVRIVPCPEAETNEPCKFKRGKPANIQFDFTPGSAATELTAQAYWATDVSDIPLASMERDACDFTPCPVEANVQTTYNYTITISRKFPPRNYNIKWKLWDNDHNPTFECCFTTRIKLTK